MKPTFVIFQSGDIVTAVDFGQDKDIAVKIIAQKMAGRSIKILSCECIGLAKDFDTEEKINQYIETL